MTPPADTDGNDAARDGEQAARDGEQAAGTDGEHAAGTEGEDAAGTDGEHAAGTHGEEHAAGAGGDERPPGQYRRRVMLNTVAVGTGNLWAIVLAVASVPLLLKGLGSVAFGSWVLIQTLSAANGWMSLADLGAGVATTRSVAERAALGDSAGLGPVLASGVTVHAILGAVATLLLATAGPATLPRIFNTPSSITPAFRFAIVVFSVQVLLDLVTQGVSACLEGLQRIDISRGIDAARRTAVIAATATVALSGGGLRGVAVASAVASAVGTVAAVLVLRRVSAPGSWAPSTAEIRRLLGYGSTVALLRGTGVAQRTLDRFVVGMILGPAAVTPVEIATQAQNGALAALSGASYVATSSSSWLRARGDRSTLQELLVLGTKYSSVVAFVLTAAGMVLAGPIVRLWVGPRYSDAVLLLVVALPYVATSAPLAIGSNMLQGMGQAKLVLRPALVAIVVNLLASVVLVRAFGAVGTFYGTLLGVAVLTPPLLRAVLRETGVPWRRFSAEALVPALLPALAFAAAAGCVTALPLGDLATLVLASITGIAATAAVALRTTVRPAELRELRDVLLRRR